MEDLLVREHPGMHRYANPHGLPALLDAIVERVQRTTGVETERGNVLVTAGATGGLGAVVGALMAPGEEVLIAAPFWPLIAGMVRSYRGTPVAVPFIGAVDSPESAIAAFEACRTTRTVAIYVNTPNNPTGQVVPRAWLSALADWAAANDLWIISDEVYEHYVFGGEHTYMRSLAPTRTFSAYSFSKAYGMAGNRCGYMLGPADVMGHVRKISTHAFYSTPTASQIAAARAITTGEGDRWASRACERYREVGCRAAQRLGVENPQGSTFLFLDVSEALDDRGLFGLLEDCVSAGLLVAPGPSFGPYPTHIRVCYTCAPPDVVDAGIEVLAGLLGR